MFIETYIALAILAVFVPIALLHLANRAYQEERWTQRWEQRRDQQTDELDEYTVYLEERDLTA